MSTQDGEPAAGVSRRGMLSGALLAGLGGAVVGAAGGSSAAWAMASSDVSSASSRVTEADAVDLTRSYPYYGTGHQGGIATQPQRHTVFMTFHLADTVTARSLQTLMARWSAAAAVMQGGKPVGSVQPDSEVAPPTDTGEAFGLSPASLTLTIGLGPSLFDGRFGLAAHKPAAFSALPPLNGAVLDPKFTGGELSVQARADDPQAAVADRHHHPR